MKPDKIYIYGKHALLEALANRPEVLERVYLAEAADGEFASLLSKSGVQMEKFDTRSMPSGVDREDAHQGYIGRVSLSRLVQGYGDFVASLSVTNDSCLVVLGEIQDPQNVGAIIRTAAGFGVAGVLIPEHREAQVTGTVVKVSAGMAFRIPLVSIGNVNDTLRDLKERGFWVYGLEGEAKQLIDSEKFDTPTVLVLGNEHTGIREKTLELCDVPLSISMHPGCESLNVAASAAVALYAWSLKHPGALRPKKK